MTVLHTGSTKNFSANWETIFSGGKKPAKSKPVAQKKPAKAKKKK